MRWIWGLLVVAGLLGGLGPKLRTGDGIAPEGFYEVDRSLLNPKSKFHLALNVGYPNALDRDLGRTGSFIMIHGGTASVGCFAMTDPIIEEIYLLADQVLSTDAPRVPVHIFPFRPTAGRLKRAAAEKSPHLSFWSDLATIYDAFERSARVPRVTHSGGRFVLL